MRTVEKFRIAYLGPVDYYLGWHDGYTVDFHLLDALAGLERQQAEAELLAALRSTAADPRAILGLGHLRCEASLPLLHQCLRKSGFATYALEAIAKINPAGLYQAGLAALLAPKTDAYLLIDLLVGLRHFCTLEQLGPLVAHRIFGLLAHPAEYLVRYHALHAVRSLYGLCSPELKLSPGYAAEDKAFDLICQKRNPAAYQRAQHLLRTEIEAAPGNQAAVT